MGLAFPHSSHTKTAFIRVSPGLCQACRKCVEACPRDVLGMVHFFRHRHVHVDHASLCKGCRKCVRVCPSQAIEAFEKATVLL